MRTLEHALTILLAVGAVGLLLRALFDMRIQERAEVRRGYTFGAVVLFAVLIPSHVAWVRHAERAGWPTRTWRHAPDKALVEVRRQRVPPVLLDASGDPARALLRPIFEKGRVIYKADTALALAGLSAGEARAWTTIGAFAVRSESLAGPAPSTRRRSTINRELQRLIATQLRPYATERAFAVVVNGRGAVVAWAEFAPAADSLLPPQYTMRTIPPGSLFKVSSAIAAARAGLDATSVAAPAVLRIGNSLYHNAHGQNFNAIAWPRDVIALSPLTGMFAAAEAFRGLRRRDLNQVMHSVGVRVAYPGERQQRDTMFWRGGEEAWRAMNAPLRAEWVTNAYPGTAEFLLEANGQAGARSSGAALHQMLTAAMNGDGRAPRLTLEAATAEQCEPPAYVITAPIAEDIVAGMRGAAVYGTAKALAHGAVMSRMPAADVRVKTGTPHSRSIPRALLETGAPGEQGTAVVGVARGVGLPLVLSAYVWMERGNGPRAAAVADSLLARALDLHLDADRCPGSL